MFSAQRFALCLAQPALIWYTYIYVTIYICTYATLSHLLANTIASHPPPPCQCCQFCQFSVEFFETPWMILADSLPLFFLYFHSTIVWRTRCVQPSGHPSLSIYSDLCTHTHTHTGAQAVRHTRSFIHASLSLRPSVRVVSLVLSLQLFAFSTIQWRSFVVKDSPQKKLQQLWNRLAKKLPANILLFSNAA